LGFAFAGADDEKFIRDLVEVFAIGAKTNAQGGRCAPAHIVAGGPEKGEESRQENQASSGFDAIG
jgi:hypothetical protein